MIRYDAVLPGKTRGIFWAAFGIGFGFFIEFIQIIENHSMRSKMCEGRSELQTILSKMDHFFMIGEKLRDFFGFHQNLRKILAGRHTIADGCPPPRRRGGGD